MAMDVSTPRTAMPPSRGAVDLLAAEPDLAAGVPAEDHELARRVLVVPAVRLAPGAWAPETHDGQWLLGYLITEGALAHEIGLAGHESIELFGPGDVVDPMAANVIDGEIRHAWRVFEPVVLAPLDHRFVSCTRKWPALSVALHRKLSVQVARVSAHTALSQLGRVELRVLAMLWHLTDRWGTVTPAGVVVGLRLTHETLGRLVGARRPTVTLALKQLAEGGLVTRQADGHLLLSPDSRRELAGPGG
jgi:CRP/FNR family transcriptional regulator, cyclic AMP receptor protein